MVNTNKVADNIYTIDNHVYSISGYGSTYLLGEEKKAIIDPGPTNSLDTIINGIKEIGISPGEVDYIIVTHIHLDHAGGAGALVKEMPEAHVVVHHRGAKHLADPTRLMKSATEAQGEDVISGFGEMIPIDRERIKSVYEGDVIELSDAQILTFIEAPGHAPHELCIHESRNNGLFTGDALGLYIKSILLPATAPPNFDMKLWFDTVGKLREMNASKIYFSHFGISNEPEKVFRSAINKIQQWEEMATNVTNESKFTNATTLMASHIITELEPLKKDKLLYEYLIGRDIPMSIRGYLQYCQRKQLN